MNPDPKKLIRELARKLKYNYLSAKGQDGGYSQEFIDSYVPYWFGTEEGLDIAESLKENWHLLFKDVCRSAWGDKSSKAPINQLTIELNGAPAPNELRYADKTVPGGFRTVLTCMATIEQFFKAWQEVQKNANTQIISASRMYAQYEWLIEAANGNQAASIADVIAKSHKPEPA